MRIGAVVQARMTSRRCPGKVLRPLGATTVLGQLLENLSFSQRLRGNTDEISDATAFKRSICVATSIESSDDPIEAYCEANGWRCVRGSLNDVAARFKTAIDGQGWEGFVRISGDSPLIDHRIVDRAISTFHGVDVDLVTNVFPRSFPRGQSVEVLRCDTYLETLSELETDHHREHVTPYFYEHAERFRLINVKHRNDQSKVQMAIDSEEDYEIANSVCHSLSQAIGHYTWPVLAQLCDDFRAQAWGVAV